MNKAPSTINVTDNQGYTPLGAASFHGHAGTALFILRAGGAHEPSAWTPTKMSTKMSTPLMAVQNNHQAVVRIFPDQGLDAVGGLIAVPEAMRYAISREHTNILRRMLLLDVQGEDRQGFWANRPLIHERRLVHSATTRDPVTVAVLELPMLDHAVGFCSSALPASSFQPGPTRPPLPLTPLRFTPTAKKVHATFPGASVVMTRTMQPRRASCAPNASARPGVPRSFMDVAGRNASQPPKFLPTRRPGGADFPDTGAQNVHQPECQVNQLRRCVRWEGRGGCCAKNRYLCETKCTLFSSRDGSFRQ